MPEINLCNVAGGIVNLLQGGQITHSIPSGFNGVLNLSGDYTAQVNQAASSTATIQTNYAGVHATNGNCFVTIGNGGSEQANWTPFGGSIAYIGSGYSTTALLPHGSSLTAQFFYDGSYHSTVFTVGNGWDTALLQSTSVGASWSVSYGSTNYTTNLTTNIGGTFELGGFAVGDTVRGVVLKTASLEVSSFVAEGDAFAAGFAFGLTVLAFQFMLRTIRAIPSGGDF